MGDSEVTTRDFVQVLRERWRLVAICLIVAATVSFAYHFARPATYTADVQMYVSTQGGTGTQDAFQGAQLSEQRVKSYTELVSSDRVMSAVIDRLDLQLSPAQLRPSVSATSALDSVVITISASSDVPQIAADITNATADSLVTLVNDLERPTTDSGIAPVSIRIVQEATAPTQPSSIGLALIIAMGLALGAVAGVIAAIARSALDTSISSASRLKESSDRPILASIPRDPELSLSPLVMYERMQSVQAEAFRQLRTNLQFFDVDSPARVLVVTSANPNEGKTTVAVNLALSLTAAGQRVVVVDGDLRKPRVAEVFGLDGSVGLTNTLSGRVQLQQSIQHWAAGSVDVLTAGPTPPNPSELLASKQMERFADSLRERYDYVIVDSPPIRAVTDAALLARVADGVILVARYRSTTVRQVEDAVAALQAVSARTLGCVLTASPKAESQYYGNLTTQNAPPPAKAQSSGGPARTPGPTQKSLRHDIEQSRNRTGGR